MSGSYTIEQHKTLERLAGVVSLRGWKDFEVTFDSDEVRLERHGGRAVCTVVMAPHAPTFQAHFVFATSVLAVAFTIDGESASSTAPAAQKTFRNTDEAARWLLESLETGQA
jgi:hypothetical protein